MKKIIKTASLPSKIMVRCTFYVPDVKADPTAAPAIGECQSEKDENLEMFVEEILAPQQFRAMREIYNVFEESPIPNRLAHNQVIDIESLPFGLFGYYNTMTSIIGIDFNTVLSYSLGAHTFGHELGHKLILIKDSYFDIDEIMRVINIHDKRICIELLCESFGNLLGESVYELPDNLKLEYLQRKMLWLAHI